MIQRFIDDLKDSTGNALRLSSLMLAMAAMLFVAIAFLCAALFVYVLQTEGLIYACLACAGIFLVAALIASGAYAYQARQAKARAAQAAKDAAKSATSSLLTDPMLMAVGLQVVRAVGVKRLIPILAVGGVALGIMAARRTDSSDESEPST